MTVSRVINGATSVNPQMRDRVREAIRELGYVRDASAARLRSQSAGGKTIGLILRDVANPFSAELHRAVEDWTRQFDSLVLTASNDDEVPRTEYMINVMVEHAVDGLIVAPPPGEQSYLREAVDRGLPIVLVDRPAEEIGLPYVISDNYEGILQAVLHLAAYGHRRIAFLGDRMSAPMVARLEGFVDGLKSCGISEREAMQELDVKDALEAQQRVLELLSQPQPPTAFIGARNQLSVGIVRALRMAGKQHRVAMISFDDLELAAELDPGLTAIAQSPSIIGKTAAGVLLGLINGEMPASESIVVPTRLIPRGSGEIRNPLT